MIKCDYCGLDALPVTGRRIYPHRPDLFEKRFWICDPCDARVGCHSHTDKPLGRLAKADLRKEKSAVHNAFDPLWREWKTTSGFELSRHDAYRWLAHEMKIPKDECHMGMFSLNRCTAALEAIKRIKEHIDNSLGPPCPNCKSIEHSGVWDCLKCGRPQCEDCSCNNMHYACEAAHTGGIYIGDKGGLEL